MESSILCYIFFALLFGVDGIMWHLEPNTQKCLREELQSNVLVTGEYEVSDVPGQKVDYTVSKQEKSINAENLNILL